jgi:rubrerythrin
MNIEEAIKTAIEFETTVRDVYIEAMKDMEDKVGRRIFQTLAREEQQHLEYLYARQDEWYSDGKFDYPRLRTEIPAKEKIDEGIAGMEKAVQAESREQEIDLLKKALEAEKQTRGFYEKMVNELPEDGKKLFKQFLEVEEGHVAIVQAEIDALTGSGYWFDVPDISLEM